MRQFAKSADNNRFCSDDAPIVIKQLWKKIKLMNINLNPIDELTLRFNEVVKLRKERPRVMEFCYMTMHDIRLEEKEKREN